MKFKNILLPTDFSSASLNAFNLALMLAADMEDASIELLHVKPSVEDDRPQKGLPEVEQELVEFRERSVVYPSVRDRIRIKDTILTGDVLESILGRLEEDGHDLIVMGRRQRATLAARLRGSIVLAVLKDSRTPLLTVPEQALIPDIKHIAYATAFDERDESYIREIWEWGSRMGALLSVFHIGKQGSWTDKSAFDQLKSKFLYEADKEGKIFFEAITDADDPVLELSEAFVQRNVDILTILTHERTRWEKILNPSTAERLTKLNQTPLLILH